MENTTALSTYSAAALPALASPKGKNYVISVGGGLELPIKRDVDFGVIKGTKKPSLYKSGAEKICMAYGLMQRYSIESKIEQYDGKSMFFYYLVKCELVKVVEGREYIFTSAYGSANTAEKRNGFSSPADACNGTLKMAQKRALTSAALSVSGLSDMFTQDMENEDFMAESKKLIDTDSPDAPVTTQQIRRLYAIGGEAGMNANEVKQLLAANGYTSTKQIKQKDYNAVCDLLSGKEQNNG